MQDIYDVIKNIERVYDSTPNFKILKDFIINKNTLKITKLI